MDSHGDVPGHTALLLKEAAEVLVKLRGFVPVRVFLLVLHPAERDVYLASLGHDPVIVLLEVGHRNILAPDVLLRVDELLNLFRVLRGEFLQTDPESPEPLHDGGDGARSDRVPLLYDGIRFAALAKGYHADDTVVALHDPFLLSKGVFVYGYAINFTFEKDDEHKNFMYYTPIIPNTQMKIFKFKNEGKYEWLIELIVQPMDQIVILVIIMIVVMLSLLGVIIYLHVREVKEEQKETTKFKSWFA